MAAKKILVIDDERVFLELVKIKLEASGYDVVTAHNGQEGLAGLKRAKPDAVLLDIMMPDKDGLDVLKEIRDMNKDIPIFMITAFSNEERFNKAKALGASGFLSKTDNVNQGIQSIISSMNIIDRHKKKEGEPR